MELKTQGFVDQLVEDQKPNNTKDTSNRPGKQPMATWEFN